METVQFKTNIKCSGCVAAVTPALDNLAGQDNWEVDLQSPDKILTVAVDKAGKDEIKQAIEKAGYKAEERN
ncbi:heavy-metal-associated domain-containing protein [Chitinophaga sp. 212800010-3]|uniref:heavy-metal-associated domain-containing protein n=1 Tax=unclassified Chitinophaga TaxID=2619133 RepID=UPI002DE7A289|nr:HMA domain-containing protein [Chitinophaga sp. 212800010-3]